MLAMPNVTTNDGTRKRSETHPFHQPMNKPMARMMPMAA